MDFFKLNKDEFPDRKQGRPEKGFESADDRKRQQSVSLSNNERKALEAVYGSLTKAIRTLLTKDK